MEEEHDFVFCENEFGNEISFREGKPIQLLKYVKDEKNPDEYGEIIINEEALDIIKQIDEPISIIAVGKPLKKHFILYVNAEK